jgi:hypothetical protein
MIDKFDLLVALQGIYYEAFYELLLCVFLQFVAYYKYGLSYFMESWNDYFCIVITTMTGVILLIIFIKSCYLQYKYAGNLKDISIKHIKSIYFEKISLRKKESAYITTIFLTRRLIYVLTLALLTNY